MPGVESSIDQFESALLNVDRQAAKDILDEAVRIDPQEKIIERLIVRALDNIGKKWETGETALSQVYMSGVICEELIADFTETQSDSHLQSAPQIAIATFRDHHSLGKRIVLSVLVANGLKTMDYGQGVEAETLVRKVQADGIKILLISTLMLPSALHVPDVRRRLEQLGLDVKIIVGGAPFRFDEALWRRVGADAMGRTSSDAVEIVRQMLEDIK